MTVRRVVTGHDASGKAVVASDDQVASLDLMLNPEMGFYRLWGGDETPRFPDDGAMPDQHTYFPPVGGFRFGMFTVPPDDHAPPADLDVVAALADMEEKLPGLGGYMEPESPGMHTTDTIDFEIVLRGSCTLELDDGVVVELNEGDTVVQNGTRHRWGNRGTEPCLLGVFIVGAHHEKFPA